MKENHHRLLYKVTREYQGMRIKDILREEFSLSTRLFKTIKDNGFILLNGERTQWFNTAKVGDLILVDMGEEQIDAAPIKIPLEIIYEDFDVLLINKSPHMVTHPTKGHIYDTLANGIAHHWMELGISCKIRFVSRLDMDTSGLILIAKNKYAHQNIQRQMDERRIKRIYWAFVEGKIREKKGTIDAPIGLATEEDIKRGVIETGKRSITHYKVIEEYSDASLVELELETGRTHQIRVHMEYMGHPLIGDPLYNPNSSRDISRQALHARELGFIIPRKGSYKEFIADLPEDLICLKRELRHETSTKNHRNVNNLKK